MTHSDGLRILNFCSISENYFHTNNRLPHDTNSTCAAKPWPWRVQRWVKLSNPTLLGRYKVIWSRHAAAECWSSAIQFEMKMSIWIKFQKKVVTRIFICRATLIRRALQTFGSGASNSGSNFQIRHFWADMESFEVAMLPQNVDSPPFDLRWKSRSGPNFRKKLSHEFLSVVRLWFDVRCKPLTLARQTVGQTFKSDTFGPILIDFMNPIWSIRDL